MKRFVLTSMLTVAGLMAQGTGAQTGSAPVAPSSKAPAAAPKTKVKRHKKASKKPAAPASAVKPAAPAVQK
jgi:hypothetical protein